MCRVTVSKDYGDCVVSCIINDNEMLSYMMQGYKRAYKSISTIRYTCMPLLSLNQVRLNAMLYYTHMLRTSECVDIDDLKLIPSYIINN
jgi:hypothetical protein